MNDDLDDIRRSWESPAARLLRSARRHRGARMTLGAAALLFGSGMLGMSWAFSVAGPSRCEGVSRTDLSLEEIVTLKRKVEASAEAGDVPLTVNGEEASFILNDHLRYPVWIVARGDELSISAALPEDPDSARCFHVQYQGSLSVDEGVLVAVPRRMVVGHLDLTAWVSGRTFRIDERLLDGGGAAEMLGRVSRLRVHDSQIDVVVHDLEALL